MSERVHVILASAGSYSDTTVWPVLVVRSAEDAEATIERMQTRLAEIRAEIATIVDAPGATVERWELPYEAAYRERVAGWLATFGADEDEWCDLSSGDLFFYSLECAVGEWPARVVSP